MPNITLSLPEDVYKIMKKHKEIRWSEIARQAIEKFTKKIEFLDQIDYEEKMELFNKLFQNSELNEEDILKLDNEVKENIFKRIMEKRE